jgi:hypothetical protein
MQAHQGECQYENFHLTAKNNGGFPIPSCKHTIPVERGYLGHTRARVLASLSSATKISEHSRHTDSAKSHLCEKDPEIITSFNLTNLLSHHQRGKSDWCLSSYSGRRLLSCHPFLINSLSLQATSQHSDRPLPFIIRPSPAGHTSITLQHSSRTIRQS